MTAAGTEVGCKLCAPAGLPQTRPASFLQTKHTGCGSSCGYCDPRNRQSSHFVCGFCGNTLNADTNGARNIASRRSAGLADHFLSRKAVLHRLDTSFNTQWGLPAGNALKLRRQPKKRRPITPKYRRAPSTPPTGTVEITEPVVNKQLRNQ